MAGAAGGLATVDSGDAAADAPGAAEVAPDLEAQLEALTVAVPNDGSSYERGAFEHWVDDDRDGCDARQEVLISESRIEATLEPNRCRTVSGEWLSIYDGLTVSDPGEIQIDHVVALKEAWRSGADQWDDARRRAYANDLDEPLALIAVTGTTNQSKSDRDPTRWRPPEVGSWCEYATAWITVKVKWMLTVDEAEVAALRDMLATC